MADYGRIAGQALEAFAASEVDQSRVAGQALVAFGTSELNRDHVAGMALQSFGTSELNRDHIAGIALQVFAVGPLFPLNSELGPVLQGPLTAASPEMQGAQAQLQGGWINAELEFDQE